MQASNEMQTWKTVDKSSWPRGEWDNEPDKAHWIDKKSNLDCLIVRNPLGSLCGYAGVTEGHPLFMKNCTSWKSNIDICVHGGVTYSDLCQEVDDHSHGVCHIPKPHRKAKVWWIGFDCSHAGDLSAKSIITYPDDEYRNFDYVKKQVESLAMQLKKYQ